MAFRETGLDIEALSPAVAGARLAARPGAVELAAILDLWAFHRRALGLAGLAGARHLIAVAKVADPDPWRNRLRDALASDDRETLRRLADSAEPDTLPVESVLRLASALINSSDVFTRERAVPLLRRLQRRHPDDSWANADLAAALRGMGRPYLDESNRFATAAVALRPRSSQVLINLGLGLDAVGRHEEAIVALQDALHLRPGNSTTHNHLGDALRNAGRIDEAVAEYLAALRLQPNYVLPVSGLQTLGERHEAIAALRKTIQQQPGDASAHYGLGVVLERAGRLDEAIAAYREAIRLRPGDVSAHSDLGNALRKVGRLDEAIAEYREAKRLGFDVFDHRKLGDALRMAGRIDEAVAEYCAALRRGSFSSDETFEKLEALGKLDEAIAVLRDVSRRFPEGSGPHCSLGDALRKAGHIDEAAAQYRAALRRRPDDSWPLRGLESLGKRDEAIAVFREVIRVEPSHAFAHFQLGNVLRDTGSLDEAIAAYREVIRLQPNFALAYTNLGIVERRQGEFAAALDAFRRGHELGSKDPKWREPSAQWVRECERLVALDRRLPAVLRGEDKPADAADQTEFARLCSEKGWHATAVRFWEAAFASRPELTADLKTNNRYDAARSAALAGCGRSKDKPPPDESARAHLRGQALAWLRADLTAWAKSAQNAWARDQFRANLRHWLVDPDLAGLRDEAALTALPEVERQTWSALWSEAKGWAVAGELELEQQNRVILAKLEKPIPLKFKGASQDGAA